MPFGSRVTIAVNTGVLVMVLLSGRDTTTKATFTKEHINWGLVYSFRGFVHYPNSHGMKHGGMQA